MQYLINIFFISEVLVTKELHQIVDRIAKGRPENHQGLVINIEIDGHILGQPLEVAHVEDQGLLHTNLKVEDYVHIQDLDQVQDQNTEVGKGLTAQRVITQEDLGHMILILGLGLEKEKQENQDLDPARVKVIKAIKKQRRKIKMLMMIYQQLRRLFLTWIKFWVSTQVYLRNVSFKYVTKSLIKQKHFYIESTFSMHTEGPA